MSNKPSTVTRQYSLPEKHAILSHNNPDNLFDYTVEQEGTPATPTRLQTIDQLKEEKAYMQELLVVAAVDRQACLRRVEALEKRLSLLASERLDGGGRKSRRKKGGRKTRRKRRRRKTKKRKTKKRKTNRKKRKTKRRR